ncbi:MULTISPECIES: CgeB family protein [Metabacillus]|uniref:Glycosyltransferase n=2 Tax=Metabacillus TaxID=2675233 RepID=A0A179T3D0_9BACI|nr:MULTISPECIES: glycosyltransferase [Metabacillus]OAS88211.1 glycosyltransferase [Metabacillus litoralis]QNF27357.1 glycosyltransferase [Metabacillus sp. KUDC1714]
MNPTVKKKLDEITNTRKWLEQKNDPNYKGVHIKEISNSKWFMQSDAPIEYDVTKNVFTSQLKDKKHAYLSFHEMNTNFSKAPEFVQVNLKPSETYKVTFSGENASNIDITLMIISYSGEEKKGVISVPINESENITISPEIDNTRFAIRISGAGLFEIETIQIGDIQLWNNGKIQTNGNYSKLDHTEWYTPNNATIQFDKQSDTFNVDLKEKEYVYLPYNEANIKFADLPQNPIYIEDRNLPVVFSGKKDSTLDVKLFIILYNGKEREEVHQIDLNSKKYISLPADVNQYRLAVRVSGSGNFTISSIIIAGKGYWLTKNFKNKIKNNQGIEKSFTINKNALFGLGRDNKVIYHQNHSIFESRLVGKQYYYLPCLENIDVKGAPNSPIFIPKSGHYYEFYPSADLYNEVNLTLFVAGYRNQTRQELYQIPFNKFSTLRFSEKTNAVKFFIRVSDKGYFKNLEIGFNEKAVEVTNSLELDLAKQNWYPSHNKLVQLSNENGQLVGNSTITDGKRVYISYKETNNSFGVAPSFHIMSVNQNSEYEFTIQANVDEGLELLPMFVGYAGENKTQVLQLKLNSSTKVKLQDDITQFRIAFRVAGMGTFRVEEFSIKEMEVVQISDSSDWISSNEITELGLVKPKPLNKLKMAVIFDEFTTASYEKECELIKFTPDNWLETLSSNKPDLLMVESAWQGNGGSWNKKVGYYGEENFKSLSALLKWCNTNNIPTVFWNKEDPVHFNRFIETAKRFDYIFTTDENMVEQYKENAGHENAFSLPFAAQPMIHNPIKIVDERINKACFAGSYYRHHEDRSKDMDRVLDYAAKYGLEIFDRNYEKTKQGLMPNHTFPDRFTPFIKGSLKYYEIDKAYKGYKVMINVNTVKFSPTMFSRRVFEGLACGTPVVSTYAEGIENIFGDLVYISENEDEIDKAFNSLLNSDNEYRTKSVHGIREVLSKHTYTHRLKFIAETIGLPVYEEMPKVTVIAFAHSKDEFLRALEQFERQDYENKELYVMVDTFEGYLELFNKYNSKNVKTFVRSFMHNYQNIMEWIDSPYITFISNNDYYGKNYLLDLMLCTSFTDSDFIGKSTYFGYNEDMQSINEYNTNAEYEFVTSLNPARTIVKTDVFAKESLLKVLDEAENGNEYAESLKYGKKFYSNDKYNYLAEAYGNASKNKHLNLIEL